MEIVTKLPHVPSGHVLLFCAKTIITKMFYTITITIETTFSSKRFLKKMYLNFFAALLIKTPSLPPVGENVAHFVKYASIISADVFHRFRFFTIFVDNCCSIFFIQLIFTMLFSNVKNLPYQTPEF